MTTEQAIEILTNAIQTEHMTAEQDRALAMAQKSLEKHIPKKPIKNKQDNYSHCPECNASRHINILARYCPFCGQALDWRQE